jgi:glycosyltransferase involved in cell wall biosynthesis
MKKIAIDLEPMLVNGDNGGAKIFILELIKNLSLLQPSIIFYLIVGSEIKNDLFYLFRNHNNIKFNHIKKINKNKELKLLVNYFFSKLPLVINLKLIKLVTKIESISGKKIIKDIDFDLLFCPFGSTKYIVNGIPSVAIIYDLQYRSYPEFFSDVENLQREKTFQEICLKADRIVSISNYTKNRAIDINKYVEDKLSTIYIQIPGRLNIYNSIDSIHVLKKYNLNSKEYIIYPANFWKHKNHNMLLVAFKLSLEKGLNKNIKLVLTGSFLNFEDNFKEVIYSLKIDNNVVLTNYLEDSELFVLIKNSKGLFFPSLYEGFGLPVLEAMTMGIPVACSNKTSLPEVVGDAAILFDPRNPYEMADSIIELCKEGVEINEMINRGYIRSKKFNNPTQMAMEYNNIFSNLIKE